MLVNEGPNSCLAADLILTLSSLINISLSLKTQKKKRKWNHSSLLPYPPPRPSSTHVTTATVITHSSTSSAGSFRPSHLQTFLITDPYSRLRLRLYISIQTTLSPPSCIFQQDLYSLCANLIHKSSSIETKMPWISPPWIFPFSDLPLTVTLFLQPHANLFQASETGDRHTTFTRNPSVAIQYHPFLFLTGFTNLSSDPSLHEHHNWTNKGGIIFSSCSYEFSMHIYVCFFTWVMFMLSIIHNFLSYACGA